MFFPNKTIFVHIPKTGGTSLEYAKNITMKKLNRRRIMKFIETSFKKINFRALIRERLKKCHTMHTQLMDILEN